MPDPTDPLPQNKTPGAVDFSKDSGGFMLSGRQDLNLRPLGPETGGVAFAPISTHTHAPRKGMNSLVVGGTDLRTGSAPVHPISRSLSPPCPPVSGSDVRGRAARPFLTVGQVAKRLSVCRAIVYRLIHAGRLPHLRVASAVRVRLVDLERFEQEPGGQ